MTDFGDDSNSSNLRKDSPEPSQADVLSLSDPTEILEPPMGKGKKGAAPKKAKAHSKATAKVTKKLNEADKKKLNNLATQMLRICNK